MFHSACFLNILSIPGKELQTDRTVRPLAGLARLGTGEGAGRDPFCPYLRDRRQLVNAELCSSLIVIPISKGGKKPKKLAAPSENVPPYAEDMKQPFNRETLFSPLYSPARLWDLLFSHFHDFNGPFLKWHAILNVFQMTGVDTPSQTNLCNFRSAIAASSCDEQIVFSPSLFFLPAFHIALIITLAFRQWNEYACACIFV